MTIAIDRKSGAVLGQIVNGSRVYKLDRFGRTQYECVKVLTRGGKYADIPADWVRLEHVD